MIILNKTTFIKDNMLNDIIKLNDYQILNHFPNFYELTRKDLMAKNIKKYKKLLLKEGKSVDHLDFLPLTYVLPQDMSIFIEEFKKYPNSLWILKPNNKCQGQGITLLNKTSKVKKMSFTKKMKDFLMERKIDAKTQENISKMNQNLALIIK